MVCNDEYNAKLKRLLMPTYDSSYSGAFLATLQFGNNNLILSGTPQRRRDTLSGKFQNFINQKIIYHLIIGHVLAFFVSGTGSGQIWGNDGKELWSLTSENFENGAQIGEQFGHCIATGDFNGDGLEDFAVCAPTWSDNKYKI